jgi:hypothetical protein
MPSSPPGIISLVTVSNVEENDRVIRQNAEELFGSESLSGNVRRLQSDLAKLAADCAEEGWDGYGALPLSLDSYQHAERFLCKYPRNWPMPHLTADPDGEVSFGWDRGSPQRSFSFSIGPQGRMSFVGILGSEEIHGKAIFGDSIPEVILGPIRTLYRKASEGSD